MIIKFSQESDVAVLASYVLSELKVKNSKPFTEGDFMKQCLIRAADIICPGNVKAFETIYLSRNKVADKVNDLANNLSVHIKEKSSSFEAFSIDCDKSTDIEGVAQLALYLRA